MNIQQGHLRDEIFLSRSVRERWRFANSHIWTPGTKQVQQPWCHFIRWTAEPWYPGVLRGTWRTVRWGCCPSIHPPSETDLINAEKTQRFGLSNHLHPLHPSPGSTLSTSTTTSGSCLFSQQPDGNTLSSAGGERDNAWTPEGDVEEQKQKGAGGVPPPTKKKKRLKIKLWN